jgi:hypothetical protein
MNKSETRAENIDLKHKKFPSEGELRLGVINNWGYKKLGNMQTHENWERDQRGTRKSF